MQTKHIEEFLQHFNDENLGLLQAASEGGSLVYEDCHACLLHYHCGLYGITKFLSPLRDLANAAEREFHVQLGDMYGETVTADERNAKRRAALLPLIHAEWVRRAQPVPVTFETPAKVEVLVRETQSPR